MNESFLHYVWQYQYFSKDDLRTATGEPVQVFSTGHYNRDAGPDFMNARIRVGEMQWIGNVEIHIDSSGWYQHNHHSDAAYDNVILHVVWQDTTPVKRTDGTQLPTIELKQRVHETLLQQYKRLVNSPFVIPCAETLSTIPEIVKVNTFDKVLTERLYAKSKNVLQLLQRNRGDWDETCYQTLARNFGFKVNAEPFYQLALALPYRFLMKHSHSLLQVEAMLFGMAGFLNEIEEADAYISLLQREYNLLRQKFSLTPKELHKAQWKFLRLRPANFPTLRLAQFASLLFHQKQIFSQLLQANNVKAIRQLFDYETSAYWLTHYHFKAGTTRKLSGMGESSIENIIINSVVSLLAAYAEFKDDHHYMDDALSLLEQLAPEKNHIIQDWENFLIQCKTAFDSQALIELHNNFCLRRRCLDCNIGAYLLKPTHE